MPTYKPIEERFHEKYKVNEENGCWEWTGSLTTQGYGQIKLPRERRQIGAHRLSYRLHKGDPGRLHVCHSCDNRAMREPGASIHRNREAEPRGHGCKGAIDVGREKLAGEAFGAGCGRNSSDGRSGRSAGQNRRSVRRRPDGHQSHRPRPALGAPCVVRQF